MRILFLTATYYPSTNGVAISVKATADMLRQKGHQVTILAPENPEYLEKEANLICYSSLPNPIIKDYPIPILPLNAKIANLILQGDYDIVHTHHPFHIAAFAEKFAKSGNVPLVFTYHTKYEKYVDIYLKFLPKKIRSKIVQLGTEYVCQHADMLIAPSDSLQKKLKLEYPSANVVKIPTGVSFTSNVNTDQNAFQKLVKLKSDKTILLTLSRLAKEKNIELAINSLAHLPNHFHLVIAGSGEEEDNLKTLARKKRVMRRITFLGKIEHGEVANVMSLADIFIFPSLTETQGMSLLEAMYLGLPVAAVKSELSKEWIPNYAGVLCKNNPLAFARGILKLDKSRHQAATLLIKKWASNFILENTVDTLINNYQSLIKAKIQGNNQ